MKKWENFISPKIKQTTAKDQKCTRNETFSREDEDISPI